MMKSVTFAFAAVFALQQCQQYTVAFTPATCTTFSSRLLRHVVASSIKRSDNIVWNGLQMAGFGTAGGRGRKRAAPIPKLKPKAQWDRFTDLKKHKTVKVAVRVVGDDKQMGEWLEVGRVRSENSEFTEIAVAAQRALIAEHAKRIYPLKVLPKDKVEWGYQHDDNIVEWVLVNKDVTQDSPSGIEKKIGFEGKPDPATGFYCHYSEGRLVDKEDENKLVTKKVKEENTGRKK